MPQTFASLGTVSHGTLVPADLLETFADALFDLCEPCSEHAALSREARELARDCRAGGWPSAEDEVQAVLSDLMDALNEYAPPFCYFGAHEGDGSDYGFWLDSSALESAVQDGECIRVSDSSEIPEGYEGLVAVVNDHGNVTLLNRTARVVYDEEELWSVV